MLSCSKTRGCAAVKTVYVFCLVSCIYTDAWAADCKTHRTHKKPYNGVLTAASIAASKDKKIIACRADLRCCCVSVPEIPLLPQKICAAVFCVVLKFSRLVICSNTTNEQASGHTKVLPDVVRLCV